MRRVEDERILEVLRARPAITLRRLGELVGFRSSSSTWWRLRGLEDDGVIERVACSCCGSSVWRVRAQERAA